MAGFISGLGAAVCRAAGLIYDVTLGLVVRALVFAVRFLIRGIRALFAVAKLSFIRYVGGWRRFFERFRRARADILEERRRGGTSALTALVRYAVRAMRIYKDHGKRVSNVLLPVLASAAVVVLCVYLSGFTTGIRVSLDGKPIASVPSEAYFISGADQAKRRLGAESGGGALAALTYDAGIIRRSEMTPSGDIADAVIRAVCGDDAVNACGIYVNDVFLCAVPDENTFTRVRDEILSEFALEHNFDGADVTVELTDDVKCVPGLYPSGGDIKNAEWLRSYMKGYRRPAEYHTVKAGDTLKGILRSAGLTEDRLRVLNPTADLSDLAEGTKLVTSAPVRNMSVRTTVTYVVEENIPYETLRRSDADLAVGIVSIIVSGAEGQDAVSYTDTYVDGVLTDSKHEAVRLNVREAANALVRVGTNTRAYATRSAGAYGSATTAYGYLDASSLYAASPRLYKSQGGTFVWPAPDNCFYLSQGFSDSHKGIDIISSDEGSSRGRRIVAAAPGVVSWVTYHWSWGYYIRVDHGGGITTGYAHALEGSFQVTEGQYVTAGQHLSSIGTTGNSTGYHLHFEVWVDGTRVNPLPYVYDPVTGITLA